MKFHYCITFQDQSHFVGEVDVRCAGRIVASPWNEIPAKLIQQIEYKVGRTRVVLNGYEAYNQIFERAYALLGTGPIFPLTKAIFMVRKGPKVISIILDLATSQIYTKASDWGKEVNGGKSVGWKPGQISQTPFINIT